MIVVTGATGKIGSEVMARLVEARAEVRALVRDPTRAATTPWAARGNIVQGDLRDDAALTRALDGATQLFLLTPASFALELNVVEQAARAGVKHIVKISALSAAPDAPFPMARGHASVEAKLADSGVAWTVIRPGMFAQNWLQHAPEIRATGAIHGGYGEGKVAPIDVRDIADVSVAALTRQWQRGVVHKLTGPRALTFSEMAALLSAAIGKPVHYVDLPPEKLREQMAPKLKAAGLPDALLEELLARQAAIAARRGDEVHQDITQVLERPARTFEVFARDYAGAFQHG